MRSEDGISMAWSIQQARKKFLAGRNSSVSGESKKIFINLEIKQLLTMISLCKMLLLHFSHSGVASRKTTKRVGNVVARAKKGTFCVVAFSAFLAKGLISAGVE